MARMSLMGVALLSLLAAGCAGSGGMSCGSSASRYADSNSIPPVRVPEDLTPPDESRGLAIPPEPDRTADLAEGQCLESPPPFSEDQTSG